MKLVKMRRWPLMTKVLHTCPECGYAMWKPEPMKPGNCPRCEGLLEPEHEFNVPEHNGSVLENVISLDSMTEKLGG